MKKETEFRQLPKPLRHYSGEEYIQQERAKFIFYLCIALGVTLILLIVSRFILHPLSVVSDPAHLRVLTPIFFLLLAVIACYIILIKGHYNAAANTLPLVLMATIWVILYFERQSVLIQFDTIVFIFAAMTIVPMLVRRNPMIIFAYPFFNIIAVIVIVILVKNDVGITNAEIWDYLIDVIVSFVFVGFMSYSIYGINRRAVEKADADSRKRTEAESALYKSEKRYREMALMLPQTIYETDAYGYVTYINKAGTEMYGYDQEDINNGLNVADTIIKEDKERLYNNFLATVKGNSSHGNRYMAKRKDGSLFPVEIYSGPIIENGNSLGTRGVVYDITDRVKAETELRESNELFKTLIESNPFSINLINTEGRIMMTNNAFAAYAGIPREDLTGKTIEELGIKMDHSDEILKEITEKGYIWNFETVVRYKDQKERNVILYSTSVDTANGKAILTSTVDISERTALENKLKESEALFRTMFNMTPFPITIVDRFDKITMANESFFRSFNLTPEDVKDLSYREVGFRLDDEDLYDLRREFLDKGEVSDREMAIKFPSGKTIFAIVSIKPIIIENEHHKILTTIDITERKQLEDKLLEYNQKLEEIVKARTDELATANKDLKTTNAELRSQREQLQLTLKKLEEAQGQLVETEKMASLGILTAGVAHEINNPLNYIFNGAVAIEEYIKEKYPDDSRELRQLFDAINMGIDRTAEIVKSLNKYSRGEEKKFHECDIHEIINNCLTMLTNQYKNRIEIDKNYRKDLPQIMGREGKLHQAFLNIILNAIQSIEDKGTITIRTEEADGNIKVSVRDTGSGIPKENMKNIFDPFFTTKDPGKGTGLGLSITRRIIQEHGGSINCKSKFKEGSEFIINLPLKP